MDAEVTHSKWSMFCQQVQPLQYRAGHLLLVLVVHLMQCTAWRHLNRATQKNITADTFSCACIHTHHNIATQSTPAPSRVLVYTLQAKAETTRILQATPTSMRALTRTRTP